MFKYTNGKVNVRWAVDLTIKFQSEKEAKEVIAYLNTIVFLVFDPYECINF